MERKTRGDYRNFGKAYYHFNLERLEGRNIFTRPEDYRIGMATVALLTLKYNVQIFAFELLPNHAHIVLYSDGPTCLEMFAYIKRRLSKMLADKGEAPLPENYGFRLTPIEDKEALIIQILYTVRNHYEKNFCTPYTGREDKVRSPNQRKILTYPKAIVKGSLDIGAWNITGNPLQGLRHKEVKIFYSQQRENTSEIRIFANAVQDARISLTLKS